MSLTKQIQDPNSPVGGFLRKCFPSKYNRRPLGEIRSALTAQAPIHHHEKDASRDAAGLIGHAIDYRIRYHFAPTPANELTMAHQGAWAVTRSSDLIHQLRAGPSGTPDLAITALGGWPEPQGKIIKIPLKSMHSVI